MLVDTDFLSMWNSTLLFGDLFLLVEIQFLKITSFLLVETDFLAGGNHFFLPFSHKPATDNFIFPSNGQVFVNKFCILVSQSGFSG